MAAAVLMSPSTIVSLAISEDVIVPVRANLVLAMAADALISASTIVPSRIIVLVTVPVSLSLIKVALVGIVVPLIEVAVATPSTGVTRVGLVANTAEPVPVSSVRAVRRFALDGVPRNVATPVPSEVIPVPPLATGRVPVTPVVRGSPVVLVSTPDAGVPSAGVVRVGEVRVLLVRVCAPVRVTKAAVSVIPCTPVESSMWSLASW